MISPLLSNIYLNEVDRMLERARRATRFGKYTDIEYARFADDLVILVDAHPRHDWLLTAVDKRLREELASCKSRSMKRRVEPWTWPGRKLRLSGIRLPPYPQCTRANGERVHAEAQEANGVVAEARGGVPALPIPTREPGDQLINPMLRGWVNYFAVGHSSECFSFIQDWVEMKIRRHMMRARKRQGFGWTRWSRQWLYETLGLFNGYRVRGRLPKAPQQDRSHNPWREANR